MITWAAIAVIFQNCTTAVENSNCLLNIYYIIICNTFHWVLQRSYNKVCLWRLRLDFYLTLVLNWIVLYVENWEAPFQSDHK